MIQDQLFSEIKDSTLFGKAAAYGSAYLDAVFNRPVYPEKAALEALTVFDEALPDETAPAEHILDLLQTYGAPATVAQAGGRYYGFVNGGIVPAGLAARLLSDFWDQNTAMRVISPLAAKLETVVQRWLIDLFGLPESTVAGFVSGTSMATFCGLAAARYRLLKRQGWDIGEQGMSGAPRLRVVAGRQAHSTVVKTLALLGFGRENIEWVDADDQGRIRPTALPQLDDRTVLILQAGNVNTGAFDDFRSIGGKARNAGAWIHIDGAFGLWAAAADGLRQLTDGMEDADSWSVDGHKTLNTPYDNGIALCRDGEALVSALHLSGAYLVLSEDRDGMFYTPEMSRRARIIELWATLKSLGRNGLSEMIMGMHQRAEQFAALLSAAGFTVHNEVRFNQVLVSYRDDATTKRILKAVQEGRVCWCGGSKWRGADVIRLSVCSWATTAEDIRLSAAAFAAARDAVASA